MHQIILDQSIRTILLTVERHGPHSNDDDKMKSGMKHLL